MPSSGVSEENDSVLTYIKQTNKQITHARNGTVRMNIPPTYGKQTWKSKHKCTVHGTRLFSGILNTHKKARYRGWGFSSVAEHLPSKRKALGSVPGSERKKKKKKKREKARYGEVPVPVAPVLGKWCGSRGRDRSLPRVCWYSLA